jgi:murein DD-endopeptidase MepM/ murein hydrolase activator NlpD
MKLGPVEIVPAGKRPKIKKSLQLKRLFDKIMAWFRARKMRGAYFVMITSLLVVVLVSLQSYMSKYLYVVILNDREVGVVDNAREIESFIVELNDRCGDFYGMSTRIGDSIVLVREFRPHSKPEPELVQTAIRQQLTLLTDAYMITVDGVPLVPVNSEEDLELVIDSIKDNYDRSIRGSRVLDIFIVEDLDLEKCTVEPEAVLKAEDVISLLLDHREPQNLQAALLPEYGTRDFLTSRYAFGYDEVIYTDYAEVQALLENEKPVVAGNGIRVKSLEEVTITETIPFSVEYLYDEEMWIVQKEITNPGKEGKKELVYQITRENGAEISRIKVREMILEDPVTQIETRGTAQVPSVGTGQFIWPVENGGEITPGRGFSSWHTGIDINAPSGTNVLAADSGVVWFSGWGGSQGNYLILYHGPYWTLYLHNSVNLVSKGAVVTKGDVIAKVGSTGRSSGPHLHFEVRIDDGSGEWHTYYQHIPVDPLQFFMP